MRVSMAGLNGSLCSPPCDCWDWLVNWDACVRLQQSGPPPPESALALPNGGAPGVSYMSGCPNDGSTCSYAGLDANGDPIYAVIPSPDQLHQTQVQDVTTQVATYVAPGQKPARNVDCSAWYNQLFNSTCGTPWGLYALGGIVALVLLGPVFMGKR